jgi:hypothetical protein
MRWCEGLIASGLERAGAALAALVLAPALPAAAGEADVVKVEARCLDTRCDFRVTVRHADAGWGHYANRFEILDMDGKVLATRVLNHPHVEEQPFTRELLGAQIPLDVKKVRVRAHDSDHEYGGAEVELELTRESVTR